MKTTLALDANILIRALLGVKVREILVQEQAWVRFVTTQIAIEEVTEHLPTILKARQLQIDGLEEALQNLGVLVEIIPEQVFLEQLPEAILRLTKRDIDDAHLLALSMALSCPIWTEDRDFFGIGIVTWRSGVIDRYLASLELRQ